jgi:hypothetical protein
VTFHDQLRYTFRLGSGIFLGSAILFAVMIGAKKAGYVLLGEALLIVGLVVLAVAVLTLVAGLVGRSAHRWVWFNVITRSTRTVFGRTASQRLLDSPASPILRFWLHLDPEGKDRDGRI